MDASPADQVTVVPDHMATFSPGMKLAAIMAAPRIAWKTAALGAGRHRRDADLVLPGGQAESSSARLRRPMKQA